MLDHCTLCVHHCQPVFLSFFRLSETNYRFLAFSRVFEVLLTKNLKIIQKAASGRSHFRTTLLRQAIQCSLHDSLLNSCKSKRALRSLGTLFASLLCVRRIFDYSKILVTTPEPTVRPPSRIAKRSFSSMAIGVIRVHSMSTLSPGMTISTPSGSLMLPVTSVVRK